MGLVPPAFHPVTGWARDQRHLSAPQGRGLHEAPEAAWIEIVTETARQPPHTLGLLKTKPTLGEPTHLRSAWQLSSSGCSLQTAAA